MKKKYMILIIFLFFVLPLSAFFNDTSTLVEPNRMEADFSLIPVTSPGIASYLRGGVGIYDWCSAYLDCGFGSDYNGDYGVFIRSFFKILITEFFGGTDYVAVSLGPQFHNAFGIYSSLILSTPYKNIEFYTGLDDVIYFKSSVEVPVSFLLGIKINKLLNIIQFDNIIPSGIFEINVPLTDYADYAFSFTLQYKLNYKILHNKD